MRNRRDLTQGNAFAQIMSFSLTLFCGSIFQQMYSTVDTAVVGRYVGTDQLAAVGATGSLSFFILGFVFGLTGGYSILASHAYGAKDMDRVRKVIGNTIVLSVIIILIFTPLALILTRPMLQLMDTPDNIMDDAALYISIVFGGYACTMLYNVMASLLRAFGDTRTPLFFLILSSIINIVLDIAFVVLLHWDVAGVAIATLIAQLVSGGLCVVYATRKYEVFRLKIVDVKPDWQIIKDMLRLGIPMALQSSLTAVGMVVMQASINDFGSNIIASYTAAHKVEALVGMLAMTLGTTAATFVGQNYGAKNYDRMFKGVRINVILATVYAVVSALICFLAGRQILMIFVDVSEPGAEEILDAGMTYLKTFSVFLWPYNALMVFRSALQGMGRSIYTMVGGTMECIMRIAVCLTLPAVLGYLGCCLAGPAAWVGAMIPLLIAYFYEKNKLLRTVSGNMKELHEAHGFHSVEKVRQ